MLRYLLRPFAFLGVSHAGSLLAWLNWGLPLLFASVLSGIFATTLPHINLYSNDGIFVRILGFVQSLPGFYIAALAAIATFHQAALDVLMPGRPPLAKIIYNGALTTVELTRRRFLCLLFSHLTAISFLLTIGLIATTSLSAPVRDLLVSNGYRTAVEVLRWVGCWLQLAALAQMLVVTFYGLFYLGERIHVNDV